MREVNKTYVGNSFESIRRVRAKHMAELMGKPNVIGVGIQTFETERHRFRALTIHLNRPLREVEQKEHSNYCSVRVKFIADGIDVANC
jgi:hypothetical protein